MVRWLLKVHTRIIYEIFLLKKYNNFPRVIVSILFFSFLFFLIFSFSKSNRRCDNKRFTRFCAEQEKKNKGGEKEYNFFRFRRKSSFENLAWETRALNQFSIKRVSKWLQRSFVSNSISFFSKSRMKKFYSYLHFLLIFVCRIIFHVYSIGS